MDSLYDITAHIIQVRNELYKQVVNKVLAQYLGREAEESDHIKVHLAMFAEETEYGSEHHHLIYNYMDLGIIKFVYPNIFTGCNGGISWLPYHRPQVHPPIPRIVNTFFE